MPLLAEGDVTIQKLLSEQDPGNPTITESVTLVYGDSLGEDEVPDYVLESIKSGTAGPIKKVTEKAVAEAQAKVAAAKNEATENLNTEEINASNADEDGISQ